jgi:uncharacterized membrane protein HdeD (DUF308 family)
MAKIKTRWCELFLGAVFLLGGIISILVPAMELESRSLVTVMLGITFLLLGSSFIWKRTKDIKG